MRSAALAAVLAGVLAADTALVVARSGDDDRSAPRAVATPTPTPSQVPVDDLEPRLRAPEGFERVDDSTSNLGTLDVAAYAARFSRSEAETEQVRKGLVALGFESARGHLWADDGVFYACAVVRLRTPAAARQLVTSSTPEEGRFRSATVPGALTFVNTSGGFSVQHGLFARDRFAYEVTLTTSRPETDHARFDALLKEQRDHAERADP